MKVPYSRGTNELGIGIVSSSNTLHCLDDASDNTLAVDINLSHGQKTFRLQINTHLSLAGVTAIYGPSGAGKTTLLRCIAGLQPLTCGSIRFRQTLWQDASMQVPVHQRGIAYVCQSADLFAHLNVLGNLRYAQRRAQKRTVRVSAAEVIDLLALAPLLQHHIDQLSGGERQRVALARALLSQPSLLLLDEPLASVDQHQRATVLPYIQRLCAAQLMPILYVSHDLSEVAALAHDIVHLVDGKLRQQGPARQLLPALHAIYDDNSVEINALKVENAQLKARCAELEMGAVAMTIKSSEETSYNAK